LSGIGIALLGQILAQPLIALLLGARYEAAGRLLAWLLWAAAAIFASAAPVTWLTVTNRQHFILIALLCADLLGLVLTLVAGGLFKWGLEGICAARISTSWFLCWLYLLFGRFSATNSLYKE
jgi:O-antigen/teichoic acid export membrane protein